MCYLQAGQCSLDRQYPSVYGQNIYVTDSTAPSIDAAVTAWAAQEVYYNYASPQFTEATEDFTQVRKLVLPPTMPTKAVDFAANVKQAGSLFLTVVYHGLAWNFCRLGVTCQRKPKAF